MLAGRLWGKARRPYSGCGLSRCRPWGAMQCQRRTDTTFAGPVVHQRERVLEHQRHREYIRNVKPAVDTAGPTPQPHLQLYGRDFVARKRATVEAAFADLKMIQAITRELTRPPKSPQRKGPISLNASGRAKEIQRIMKENHRLLESLEQVKPVMVTKDILEHHRGRQRYVINCSHTKRLSGEYDDDLLRIQGEDRDRYESQARSAEARRMQLRGSRSAPTLGPPGPRNRPCSAPAGPQRGPWRGGRPGVGAATAAGSGRTGAAGTASLDAAAACLLAGGSNATDTAANIAQVAERTPLRPPRPPSPGGCGTGRGEQPEAAPRLQ